MLLQEAGKRTDRTPWGIGEEIILYRPMAGRDSEYHLFFDHRGLLIGYIGILYEGLDLSAQPNYSAWIKKQLPTEFLMPSGLSGRAAGLRSGRLYSDQGPRTSGRAIVISSDEKQILYLDSNALTPFASLITPYKPEYLRRVRLAAGAAPPLPYGPLDSEGRDYIAHQHFAQGEAARVGLCGDKQPAVAVEAYLRASEIGLSEPRYQAEAQHRLGLSYRDTGQLPQAAAAIENSLKIRPSIPEVVNHLGKVYSLMGEKTRALEQFQSAIGLRPNYADAHFNLAEALEDTQPRRAVTAYENYLAYVQQTPEEEPRMEKAKKRVEELRKAGKF